MRRSFKLVWLAIAVTGLALGLAACGDDDDTATTDETPTEDVDTETETEDDAPEGEVVEITAVDWAFEGVPESVEAGTKLSLVNEGEEPHELVAIRIPDEETRPVSEIVALPEEELGAVFGGEPTPATVLLAATGTTDTPGAVMGDGTLTEPGRYAIVCFLPVGSDDSILESAGPPEGDAPPHVSQGMFAELVVS
jgi:plastocyanin